MQYRSIGGTEMKASAVVLGTWGMGGWMWGGCDDSLAERTILTALDAGINIIDTAPIYGFGRSEETVGRALQSRQRDQVIIASKCGLYWNYFPLPADHGEWHCYSNDQGLTETLEKYVVYRWLRPEIIRQGVEDSLRRLKTDYIDIMQVHHVGDRTTPIADTMGELEELKREGKIRAIGISNATKAQLCEYASCGVLDVDQERYSMLDRNVEKNGVLDACKEKGVSFFAYSPLENGLLTGKLSPDTVCKPGDLRLNNPQFSKENITRVNTALERIAEIAGRFSLTIPQFSAAWILARYEKAFVLCGSRSPDHILDNSLAGNVSIDSDSLAEVDSILDELHLLK